MAPETRRPNSRDSKNWMVLGLLGAAVLVAVFALFSGKPNESPKDPRSAEAITQPDRTPPAPETTPQTTLPR